MRENEAPNHEADDAMDFAVEDADDEEGVVTASVASCWGGGVGVRTCFRTDFVGGGAQFRAQGSARRFEQGRCSRSKVSLAGTLGQHQRLMTWKLRKPKNVPCACAQTASLKGASL